MSRKREILFFDTTNLTKMKTSTAQFKGSKENGFGLGINISSDKAGDGNMQNFFRRSIKFRRWEGGMGWIH